MIDGVIALLHIHVGRVTRLRSHFPRAGHPAHAAHVRSNFVHGIVLVGAMVPWPRPTRRCCRVIGVIGVILGAGNAVGGYVVYRSHAADVVPRQKERT